MTPVEFAKGMAVLSSGVGREMPKEMASVWFSVLGDMTAEQLQRAIVHVLREHKFAGFPPVGLLRQVAGESGGVLDIDAQANLAWDEVIKNIRKFGAYHSIQWKDPAIAAAIETIAESWPALCDTPTDELHQFTRKRFLDAWKAHRAARTECPAITTGILAADAGKLGYVAPDAVASDCKRLPAVVGFGVIDSTAKRLPSASSDEPAGLGGSMRRITSNIPKEAADAVA